ncbi:S24 family peptidase [Noviherbaspirillum humi]|nr:S24 family peptidase [Noviherbaspirillum humi]
MSTLAERIQEVIDAGYSQVDLARAANVTKGTANQWLNGGIKSIKLEYAQAIEDLTGFSAVWLVTGRGDKRLPGRDNPSQRPQFAPVQVISEHDIPAGVVKIRKVKLRLSAGISGFSIDEVEEDGNPIFFRDDWLAGRGYYRENLIALRVKGQSMEPGLYEGDTVVINTADTKPKDGSVFAVNYEGEAVIKRLQRDIGFWWLVSDNSDQRRYPKKRCEGEACIILGRVVHKQSEQI